MGSCTSIVASHTNELGDVVRRRAKKILAPTSHSLPSAPRLSPKKRFKTLIKKKKQKSLEKAERLFRKSNSTFDDTSKIDHLRATDYPTLDGEGHIYLDYTGGGLYADSQLRAHHELLARNIFGNPHSLNPTSSAITELDEQARARVLSFFNASPDEYAVVFTHNASAAMKLVGESYPFCPGAEVILLWDNHNSAHGIREYARSKGATISYIPVSSDELRADESVVENALLPKDEKISNSRLFIYPAQSNFSGIQHPLEWIDKAHEQGCHVMLDAAAFVPTNRLDLSRWHPDFVPVSFYKMFGYPTGAGCLIARREALAHLKRPWFAGGTVWGSSVQADGHVLLEGHEAFEDGTINYLNLPAVHIGLNHLARIGMETIHERVVCLTDWVIKEMLALRHSNGVAVVRLYGAPNTHRRGGTITFNFITPAGEVVDERIVEKLSSAVNISLRTGCFCNPGAGEAALRLTQKVLVNAFNGEAEMEMHSGHKKAWDDFLDDMGLPSGGGIRISLGLMSNFADVYRFVQFAHTFIDTVPVVEKLAPRLHC
ncbi:cysteine desulfurase [Histoplasma capsulatum G186AR]|uniref:Cysteine desulfurase n=1 Tax=Ajellomyces capsulatus (strain G186AR / H82 / ATCC MYA-2454 / RMSCC 2432) TaxID=447093 RepID=C0NZZ7_AJECG|nr:cysteine desulfurase [Histoplasma capsulatum G186AR]EEH03087.1 cysteine desulfurase [Histoplasma capsulatum G186AR]